jgi:hypothetical protein
VLAAHLDLGLSRPLVDDRPAILVLHRLPLVIGSVQHLNAVFAEAGSDSQNSSALSDYQRECQLGNKSNTIFVVDCDIRINTPELRQGGTRQISNIVVVT